MKTALRSWVDVDVAVVTNPEGVCELALGGSNVLEVSERGRPEVEKADVNGFCGPDGRGCCRRRTTHEVTGRHGPWGAKRGGLAGGLPHV